MVRWEWSNSNNGYVSQLNGETTYVFDGALVNGLATGKFQMKT
jgi:hypothetical protein